MREVVKKAMLIAHNNTHSTSRILRQLKLIRRDNELKEKLDIRLSYIEEATLECIDQVNELYKIIKNGTV